jgi:lipopolysaccharide/colanic/teichoic acid biosynthesis glycosyltransferase
MAKRCIDIAVALTGLIVLAPVYVFVAIFIACVDGSPILFRQVRLGWRGQPFTILKFRTMVVHRAESEAEFQAGNTARVTRVGRFLRSTKLDELPQLWNVLRGQMSLVGPRPEVEQWVAEYPERWALVHDVKPGITDPASIVYRNEEQILSQSVDPELTYRREILPRKLALYENYVRTRSLTGDIRIVLQTLVAVMPRLGRQVTQ